MNPEFLTEFEALATKYSYHVYGNAVDLSADAESSSPVAFDVNAPIASSDESAEKTENAEGAPADENTAS